jgi:tetratricopeptide (TPR) repeat protein
MKSLTTVQSFLIRAFVFILPLFFLPITADFFDFNKGVLLLGVTLLSLLFWAVSRTRGEFRIRTTPFDLPVFLFAIATVVSALVVTPNKYDAFVFPGTATVVLAGTFFYFVVVQYLQGQEERHGSWVTLSSLFLLGSSIAAFISVLAGVGALSLVGKAVGAPAWFTQNAFNTVGGILPAATLFFALLPLAIGGIVKVSDENRRNAGGTLLGVVSFVMLAAGLAVNAFMALPGKATSVSLLPLQTGWSIVLETLKRDSLLGVGVGNFIEAFNRFRPIEYNASGVWNLRFASSSNWYLDVWTVAGLLGVITFLWIVVSVITNLRRRPLKFVHYSLITVLVLFALVPGNFMLLVTFYLLLAIVASPMGSDIALAFSARGEGETGRRTNLLPGFLALVALAAMIGSGYMGGKIYAAEVAYKSALDSAIKNDGRGTYDNMVKAIQLNPFIVRYRIDFSRTNLALANSIASNKDLQDADRQTISQLIQQAIREGQAAVALNQGNAVGWENLAGIYQAIIPFAQGADQYTVASYQQAIALDPVNPLLRLSLGGVFYSLGDFESAAKTFELAVAAKPDFANAHYNLAVAYREKGNTAAAAQEMANALSLVTPGTSDYDNAKKELDALNKKLADAQATQSAQVQQDQTEGAQLPLQAPSPAPSPALNPQIQLPSNAAPATSATPSPIPAP